MQAELLQYARLGGVPMTADELADVLRSAIERGEYAPGHQLPSQRALAQQFGVAAATAQGAFNALMAEGLITGRRGAGVFVRRPAQLVSVDELISGFGDLEWSQAPAPRWVEAALGLEPGQPATRGHAVAPDRLYTTWHRPGQKQGNRPEQGDRTGEELIARAAAPDERELLGLRAGVPVLAVEWLHRPAADEPANRAERVTALGAAYRIDLGAGLAKSDHET